MLIKTPEEIIKIKEGGQIIGRILEDLANMCKPGVSTWEIDMAAEKMIIEAGGRPAFKGYKNKPSDPTFPSTICASVNEELVHGIAKKEVILKNGDIFTIDIGMEWPCENQKSKIKNQNLTSGYYTDTAITVPIGKIAPKTRELLRVTQESLEAAIKVIKPGNTVADIGRAIEDFVKSQGRYGIIRDLVGHGVGHAVHEEPRIPNFYDRSLDFFVLKPGMVIAIEPMVALGCWRVTTATDGWTIVMADGSLSAHFEHTIIVTKSGNFVATRRPSEL
ncbi:MAG: Methionine aminopeptidase [Candidatus Magasanikbacteria bacterium GW2011_GWA2_40_10]|uniref:Methionine aminopeptidase n=1 Tax=Candidatus Magasanikbacteria bacterium GW2011_GWA2_40_10 TaxID=1619037 RepID=A0A0G0SK92_9BACT|nr:MAG: Methionine aminopeptidase [Candidatus Magasanikbacteria bacterium GW2011_GWA2_40_10]